VTEAKVLKSRGALVHPNSGAGAIKDDGHDDDYVYEVKDVAKTITVNGKEVLATHIRALRQGKQAKWLLVFTELGITAEMTITQDKRELQ
jgi:hypothetical protein